MVNDAPGCVRDVFSDVASTSESNYVEPVVSWLEEKKKKKKEKFREKWNEIIRRHSSYPGHVGEKIDWNDW